MELNGGEPMRLIDGDALIAQMEADAEQMEEPIAKMFTYAAINDVKHAPTIEERKKGKWLYGEDDSGQDGWFCSECGFFIPWYYSYCGLNNIDFIRDFHTCPSCDAKMLTYTGKKEGDTP